MSEYQYYEFQALDRPWNAKQLAYIRTLSNRVELTPRQAIFTYSYSQRLRRAGLTGTRRR